VVKFTVPEVLPAVNEYYLRRRNGKCPNGNGGALHIVLEDGNVADDHIRSCIQFAVDLNDFEGLILCLVLLGMSRTQRLKLGDKHIYPEYEDYKLAEQEVKHAPIR
jgi:hypothetical protein